MSQQSQYHLEGYRRTNQSLPPDGATVFGWCQQSTTHTHNLGKVYHRGGVWYNAVTGEPLTCRPTHYKPE